MYSSIVIIGAPRSGTNMLRDMLVQLPGVGTWPCDEINCIWKHGNLFYNSDEFIPNMATPKVQEYIQEQFTKLSKKNNIDTVIEKTCANSLRIGFVDKVLPEAKYVFIVRDGLDVVDSALKRWKARLDFPYILRKTRYVPLSDIPYYAFRFLYNCLYKLNSSENRLSFWGPTLNNITALLDDYSLLEVCALQWKACVNNSELGFSAIASDKILRIKYEELVTEPVVELANLAVFLEKKVPSSVNEYLEKNIRQNSIGKGRKSLSDVDLMKVRPLIANTLNRYGYK